MPKGRKINDRREGGREKKNAGGIILSI